MIIGIDGNLMCGKKTGMGMVVYNVLEKWPSCPGVKTIIYIPEKLETEYSEILSRKGICIKILPKSNYFKWEQVILPKAVKKDNVDVLWCPYNTAPIFCPCNTVVTIHDVIYLTENISSVSSLYKKAGVLYRRTVVPIIAKKASRIITVSYYAKKEILDHIRGIEKTKVEVAYNGISDNTLNELDNDTFFSENRIHQPYLLGFGSLEARKNSIGLVKAFEIYRREHRDPVQLVLFGFRGYEQSEERQYIRDHNLSDDVIVLGYISEAEKQSLYRFSSVFVFPTLAEGFGIPILEAFRGGTPVISSDVTSIPEVAGDAAMLIDPQNLIAISESIEKVLSDDNLRNDMVEKGYRQLKKFSWNSTANLIFDSIVCASEK